MIILQQQSYRKSVVYSQLEEPKHLEAFTLIRLANYYMAKLWILCLEWAGSKQFVEMLGKVAQSRIREKLPEIGMKLRAIVAEVGDVKQFSNANRRVQE